MFDKQGDIDPIWLVENAEGEQRILVVPFIASTPLAGHEQKERIAATSARPRVKHPA